MRPDNEEDQVTIREDLVEQLSDAAHEGWMASKRANGVTTRRSESGEELMVPYADLSESAKDLDRTAVRSVLEAIARAGYVVAELPDVYVKK